MGNRPIKSSEHDDAAPFVSLAKLNTENEDEILQFANKWGLLGLWKEKEYKNADNLPQVPGLDFSLWFKNQNTTASVL
ncbi:hypothetical protein [Pseudalkalibacillus hwajinpoensis]|uniref:hypothetical protein n=1 Tax=Guptibacillus hwajinpoensis TaxID=208199 RepID=UPI001CFDD751|nr:hypothetical protein [Pseudalkalibacillus hwajinpoensis]